MVIYTGINDNDGDNTSKNYDGDAVTDTQTGESKERTQGLIQEY